MGKFVLRADSVEAYGRAPQGVPWEVKVLFSLEGGNRFERYDFAEAVSRKGRVYFTTSAGWRDRYWLSGAGDEHRTLHLFAYPPLESRGYTLEIGNPYGEPRRFIVDLGR